MVKKNNVPTYPEQFVKEYTELLGDDVDAFLEHGRHYPEKCIRINTLKQPISAVKDSVEERWSLRSVPWCKEGFWITHSTEDRHDVGNASEHQKGWIYVQSASSMIPAVVLDPKPYDIVLDTCAAPGSKTTQLAQYMDNTGLVLANDASAMRLRALGINVQRLGLTNVLVTNMDADRYPDAARFDKILCDVPCSGTGTIRKSHKVLEMWSEGLVKKMVNIQNRILRRSWELLKPGGTLVYSTCTLQPEENEGVIAGFVSETDDAELLPIDLPLERSAPVKSWKGEVYSGVEDVLRIAPMDNNTEGFFVANLRKST